MSIASQITTMQEHIEDIYDTFAVAGVDTSAAAKNIVNINANLKERLEYYLANGLDVVWNNWNKVSGSGTTLSLNNTIQAKMDFIYKGNTSQESTTGKNLIKQRENESMGITTTPNSDGSVTINGTTTSNWFTIGNAMNISIPAGTYTFSIQNTLSFNVRLDFTYNDDTYVNIGTITAGNTSRTFTLEKTTKSVFIEATNTTSGTQINETIKFMLESGSSATSWEPYTGGNPAPNPDYPYPVNVVTGDNEVKVEGKNLFDKDNIKNGYSTTATVLSNGFNANGNWYVEYPFDLENGTYTINYNYEVKSGTTMAGITGTNRFQYTDNTYSGYFTTPHTFNTDKAIKKILFCINQGNATSVDFTNVQIEKASTASEYQPYQSQTYPINLGSMELCKIRDYQDYIAKSTGKNLFNSINWRTTASGGGFPVASNNYSTIVSSDINNIEFNVSGAYGGVESDFIPVKSGETYTISFSGQGTLPNRFFVTQYDNTKTRVSTLNTSVTTVSTTTFTTTQEGYIAIGFNNTTSSSSNFTIQNIMLNEGSTALPYEPYGTGWYKYGAIGKVVLDGSESWIGYTTLDNDTTSWFQATPLNDALNVLAISNSYLYSDYFSIYNCYSKIYKIPGMCYHTDKKIQVRFPTSLLSDTSSLATRVASFKTWLASNNVSVYYILATPTVTPITDTTLINQLEVIKLSYNGQTNISQTNTDKPFILDATALKDLDAEDTTPALTTNRELLFTQPPVSENFINDEDDNSILEETINEEEPNIEDDNREEEEPLDFFEREIINNDEEQEEIPTEPIEIDNGQR